VIETVTHKGLFGFALRAAIRIGNLSGVLLYRAGEWVKDLHESPFSAGLTLAELSHDYSHL
jgi:hypothetical protein